MTPLEPAGVRVTGRNRLTRTIRRLRRKNAQLGYATDHPVGSAVIAFLIYAAMCVFIFLGDDELDEMVDAL